jgi:signal transduction histidine kinase
MTPPKKTSSKEKQTRLPIQKLQTDFVSLASHSLRTPLSAIKWFVEMLQSGSAGKLSPKQKQFLQHIYESNERMIGLVNDLLEVSRIDGGRMALRPEPVRLERVLEEVLEENASELKSKRIKASLTIATTPLPPVYVDARKIRHVIANLIRNAMHYTPAGGSIVCSVKPDSSKVSVEIKDSGFGIPQAEQGKVFQKFFRGSNAVAVDANGTGLGLYIVKGIIEGSGGKISFTSKEGKGTTFSFTLPVAKT